MAADREVLKVSFGSHSLSTVAGVLLGNNHINEHGALEQRFIDTRGSDRRLERPRNPETQAGTKREVQAAIRTERSNDPAHEFQSLRLIK